MSEHKPNLDEMLNSPEATRLLKDKRAILDLAKSPETKRLMDLLNQSGGGKLQEAAQAAMGGDASALMEIMGKALKQPESAQIVEKLNRSLPNK